MAVRDGSHSVAPFEALCDCFEKYHLQLAQSYEKDSFLPKLRAVPCMAVLQVRVVM